MARRKIGLVGAGNIGGELANQAVAKGLGDVVLLDVPEKENLAKGKALDIEQAAVLRGADVRVMGTSSWDDLGGYDVLIVTAGFPRKLGQSRDELLSINLPIIRTIAEGAARMCPGAFVLSRKICAGLLILPLEHRAEVQSMPPMASDGRPPMRFPGGSGRQGGLFGVVNLLCRIDVGRGDRTKAGKTELIRRIR